MVNAGLEHQDPALRLVVGQRCGHVSIAIDAGTAAIFPGQSEVCLVVRGRTILLLDRDQEALFLEVRGI